MKLHSWVILVLSLIGMQGYCQPLCIAPITIEEGFVTFATENYFGLLEVMIESIHQFSTRPVVAFGINVDIPFSAERFPRLIKKRIDNYDGDIYAQKPRIMLESGINYGVYLEADDIANQGIDTLFEWAHQARDYPLCPVPGWDPNNQASIMKALGVTHKSMQYIHAHVIFAQSCKEFIKEWYDACVKFDRMAGNADETVLNVLLWKYGAAQALPVYDPYFEAYEGYLQDVHPPYRFPFDELYYYSFHGCKDIGKARQILADLVAHAKISNKTVWKK
ncbi:hypothetical protein BH09DEP1_BH09DEP1_7840 [soil metagenome]